MYFYDSTNSSTLYLNHKSKVNTKSTQYRLADIKHSTPTVYKQTPKTALKVKLYMKKSLLHSKILI